MAGGRDHFVSARSIEELLPDCADELTSDNDYPVKTVNTG